MGIVGALVLAVTLVAASCSRSRHRASPCRRPASTRSLGALVGPTAAALDQAPARGVHGPVPRHVAARRGSDRLGRFRAVERARPARLRRARRRTVPSRRDPLPRDRRAPSHARSAPRDRARHRELAARLALHAGRVVRSAHRRRTGASSISCTRRSSASCNSRGSASLVPQVDNNLFMLALAPQVPERDPAR